VVIVGGHADVISAPIGLPVGVRSDATYVDATVDVPRDGVVLMFTAIPPLPIRPAEVC
jgi:hypothetical protein